MTTRILVTGAATGFGKWTALESPKELSVPNGIYTLYRIWGSGARSN